jgi:hypothetical protein
LAVPAPTATPSFSMKILCICFFTTLFLAPISGYGAQDGKVILSYSSRDSSFLPAHIAMAKG